MANTLFGTGGTDRETSRDSPTENLREAAGAAEGATGSEIRASGGAVLGAAETISTDQNQTTKEKVRTAVSLIKSGATDAPKDVVKKMAGKADPRPGHTKPADTGSGKEGKSSASSPEKETAQDGAKRKGQNPDSWGSGMTGPQTRVVALLQGGKDDESFLRKVAIGAAASLGAAAILKTVDGGD